MSNKSKTISLRLSAKEHQRLCDAIGNITLSDYIRATLFNQPLKTVRTRGARPVQDHKILSELIGMFGQSRIPQNLNQIAKAVNTGLVLMPDDTTQALNEACADLRDMRQMMTQALGKKGRT